VILDHVGDQLSQQSSLVIWKWKLGIGHRDPPCLELMRKEILTISAASFGLKPRPQSLAFVVAIGHREYV